MEILIKTKIKLKLKISNCVQEPHPKHEPISQLTFHADRKPELAMFLHIVIFVYDFYTSTIHTAPLLICSERTTREQ